MSLLFLRTEHEGRVLANQPLDPGVFSIGRRSSASIALDDPRISRQHALLTVEADGTVEVQDLGSTNGFRVLGVRRPRARLRAGDSFEIGRFTLTLVPGDQPPHSLAEGAVTVGGGAGGPDPAAPPALLAPHEFVGASPAAHELLALLRRVAETRINALIQGESGSGKGVISRLLHRWSNRADGPFIAVNCAAIPAELVESEMFGHRRGAFTGATTDRVGKFQAASNGTLFLDEIGDMSLAAQAKILRAIEEGQIEPVGSSSTVKVDVRLLAATHRNLNQAVAAGQFRADLLYRLSTVVIRVPPLRERPDDIVLIANCLLAELVREIPSARGSVFTPEAVRVLTAHDWPGNVRDLRNAVAHALLVKPGPEIRPEHFPPKATGASATGAPLAGREPPLTATLKEAEQHHIRRVYAHHDENLTHAARALGISRGTLRDALRKIGIERE